MGLRTDQAPVADIVATALKGKVLAAETRTGVPSREPAAMRRVTRARASLRSFSRTHRRWQRSTNSGLKPCDLRIGDTERDDHAL
jgi:hypothetical protein